MKKKILILSIIALLICSAVLIFKTINHQFDAWYPVTRQYIELFTPKIYLFHIQHTAKASNPGNFSADMSRETYSDSLIFYSDHDFHHSPGSGTTDLPYPPKEVYCVVGEFSWDQTEFFFVALHADGQHEAWVVHKPSGYWKGIRSLMDRIGCDMPRY